MKRAILLGSVLALLATATCGSAGASVVDLGKFKEVAEVVTIGEYDNADLSYWNGSPLSTTNKPSEFDDQLSATWDFYVDPKAPSNLYIVVTNVFDTHFGYINGEPFNLVALTGFDFSIDFHGKVTAPTYASGSAVPGETLLNSGPLNDTPGWAATQLEANGSNLEVSLQADNANYGFTHFSSVYGATRIYGGGVFEFSFPTQFNLLHRAKFDSIEARASNGEGSYTESGTLTFATGATAPEPTTWALLLLGVGALGTTLRFKRPALGPTSH